MAAQTHFVNLVLGSKLLQDSGIAEDGVLNVVKSLITAREQSLREVETFVKYLEIYQVLTNNRGLGNKDSKIIFGYLLLYVYAIYCACFLLALAQSFLKGSYSPEAVAQSLGHFNFEDFASDLPFGSQALLAMLVIDAPNTPNAFRSMDDKIKKRWGEITTGAFESGFYRLSDNYRVDVINNTLRTLSMGSSK
ncbi:hypothetical protein [Deefgea piscis]|uniref:hypothetical protein n=1 Tax=Deefgea piscis TaxID=2739061 RepID=UPI001C7EF983|nr:hypothetical protein [Deefgea piscis]QZA80130.1 hypothetical protein K4H25_11345 [Deefgea piscis]